MFICHIFSFLSLCAGAILAKPLRTITNETSISSVSPDLIRAVFASNTSTSIPALNTSAEDFLVDCDGALYGFNPNIADCERAAQSIIPDTDEIIWGERHSGLPEDFFPLPFAVFGGKSRRVLERIQQ